MTSRPPGWITREAYVALVVAAGFDPNDVRQLEFRGDGIYAETYFRDPETGKRVVNPETNTMAITKIWIPVVG